MKRLPCVFVLALALLSSSALPATAKESLPTPSQRYARADTTEAVSFRRHVIPLFSRAGCSGRECHGAFSGQGGFTLSLFGYDFAKDHKEIVADEEDGLRVDLEKPEQSLILLKPTMQERHKGKERIRKGSWEYNLVLKWIRDGARNDAKETGAFERLEVFPKEIVFARPGQTVQLKVLCRWSDGTVEDVTELTRFRTNDESVAEVSDTGVVKCLSSGDTHVVAFYDNGVQPIPVMLPVTDRLGPNYPRVATSTRLDELVVGKLRKLGIVPSELCTDAEFLRRVSIDMTGTLPTPGEVKAFLADPSPNKRNAKIEELLQRPTYAAWWATKLNDFTGNNVTQLNARNFRNEISLQWYEWIRARIANNTPYDELVAGIVLATSRSKGQSYLDFATEMSSYLRRKNPVDFASRPTMPHYWARRNLRKPEEKALSFAHAFLGVQIQCAQCHKHPFDQWTQQDFQQFQAFFEGITYGSRNDLDEPVNYRSMQKQIEQDAGYDRKDPKSRRTLAEEIKKRVAMGRPIPWQELYIRAARPASRSSKSRKKKNTGASRVLTPKILGGEEVHLTEYPDPRAPLMEWMRSKDNPYFARAFVNRVWANYFGRGIVEPADDMNLANPPSNRELLDYLANGFVDSGFDMKWLHKTITSSDTYQRSWKPNDTNRLDEKNFSHMKLRRLPAEVVNDALTQALAGSEELQRLARDPKGRAIGPTITGYRGRGPSNYALELFGKPVRLTNCDCERMSNPTLLQTLYTRNDQEMLAKLDSKTGWIAEVRGQTTPDRKEFQKFASIRSLKQRNAQNERKLQALVKRRDSTKDEKLKARFEKLIAPVRRQIEKTQATIERLEKEQAELLARYQPDLDQLVEEAFLRTLSRPPSSQEVRMAKADITAAGPGKAVDGLRDLLWTLVNTKEFMINH